MANGAAGLLKRPLIELENLGGQLLFYGRVLKAIPFTIKRYSKEIDRKSVV